MSEISRIKCVRVIDFEKRIQPTKHYVFVLRVKREDGVKFLIYRRYNAFFILHTKLTRLFPVASGQQDPAQRSLPTLPGKIYLRKSHTPSVARERIYPLQQYTQALISLPSYISECPTVVEFFTVTEEDVQAALDQPKSAEDAGSKRSSEACSEISGPVDFEEYTLLADYQNELTSPGGRAPKQRTIPAGDIVKVIQKKDTGWWYIISSAGMECWMPRSYLQPRFDVEEDLHVTSSNTAGGPYMCTQSYTKQDDDEISLTRGMLVNVLEKSFDGWWLVEHKGLQGRAPGCYLIKSNTMKARQLLSSFFILDAKILPSSPTDGISIETTRQASITSSRIKEIASVFEPSKKTSPTTGTDAGPVQGQTRGKTPSQPSVLMKSDGEIRSEESLIRVRDRSIKATIDAHRSVTMMSNISEASSSDDDEVDSSENYMPEVKRGEIINKSLLLPPPRMGSIRKGSNNNQGRVMVKTLVR